MHPSIRTFLIPQDAECLTTLRQYDNNGEKNGAGSLSPAGTSDHRLL